MHGNLQLLLAFDALLDEESVGGAATRLHLSQPAVSRILAQIRQATGDEILVRSGRRMLPTPYALSVRPEVREIVERSRAVFTPQTVLDPSTLERVFTLRANDAIVTAILPALESTLRHRAPGVTLRVLGEECTDGNTIEADVQLGSDTPTASHLHHQRLGTDHLVVIAATLPTGELTAESFAARDHIVVSRRGRNSDRIDRALELLGLRRRVVLTVPTLAIALEVVHASDLVTVAPRSALRALRPPGFAIKALPLTDGLVSSVLVWHARNDRDPAQRWFRRTLADTLPDAEDAVTDPWRTDDDCSIGMPGGAAR